MKIVLCVGCVLMLLIGWLPIIADLFQYGWAAVAEWVAIVVIGAVLLKLMEWDQGR